MWRVVPCVGLVRGGGRRWLSAVQMMVVGAMVVRLEVCNFWALVCGSKKDVCKILATETLH